MKKFLKNLSILLFLMASQSLMAGTGLLFNVTATGSANNINISLCLNGTGPLSCEHFNVTGSNLNICTAAANSYPNAGIKVNTPGFKPANLGTDCVQNSNGYCLFQVSNTTCKNVTLVVSGPLTITPSTMPTASLGGDYGVQLSTSGGVPPYTFTVSSGSLPPGLTLNSSTGVLTGIPSLNGTYNFTITATDSNTNPNTGSQAYTVVVSGSLPISPLTLPAATLNTAYSTQVTASDGTSPYSYEISAGSLPPGLGLNSSTGVISGTPTNDGTYNFTLTATDSSTPPNSGSVPYSLVVSGLLTLTPTTLPSGSLNVAYTPTTITASGGISNVYTYEVTSGSLPTGLTLNASTGVVSGTPTAAGLYNFTVTASDTETPTPNTGSRAYSINIPSPCGVGVSGATLTAATTTPISFTGTGFISVLGYSASDTQAYFCTTATSNCSGTWFGPSIVPVTFISDTSILSSNNYGISCKSLCNPTGTECTTGVVATA